LTGSTAGEIFRQVSTHLLFVHNLWPETFGTINGVFWSLGVEVQFYLLFPILFAAFQKHPKSVAFLLLVLALAFRLTIAAGDPGWLDFRMAQLPAFLDFFGLGMLAACLHSTHPPTRRKRTLLLAIAGFLAYIALLYWAHTQRYSPGNTAWQVVGRTWLALSFFAMTRYGLAAGVTWTRAIANPVLVFLSTISYNLYLWHQFIGRRLVESRIPDYLGSDPHGDPRWQVSFTVIAAVASVAVSALLTYALERPILRASHRQRLPKVGD
jgi:peptidoglycan/LPS O-acetylase OafA/YrhL